MLAPFIAPTADPLPKPVTIYAMAHPDKPALIRYIGKTRCPLIERRDGHIHAATSGYCRSKSPVIDWVRKLFSNGIRPVIWPIEICNETNWEDREKYWIWFFKPLGIHNLSPGGKGGGTKGRIKSIQERLRLSASNIGKKHTPESIEKMRASQRKLKGTPEAREHNRRIQLIVKNTPEYKARASFWRKRFWNDPAYKSKADALRVKLRHKTPEHIANIRAASKLRNGIELSASHKRLLSISHRGHSVTEETKAKIRNFNLTKKSLCRPVICRATGVSYKSITDAERKNSIHPHTLRTAMRRGKPYRGQIWNYL